MAARKKFTEWPNKVLDNIFKKLPLSARYRLSLTCRGMRAHFQRGELWESVCMTETRSLRTGRTYEFVTFPWRKEILTKFGRHIKKLTLFLDEYPEDEQEHPPYVHIFGDLISFSHWDTIDTFVLNVADREEYAFLLFSRMVGGRNKPYKLVNAVRKKNQQCKIYIDLVETVMSPDFYQWVLDCPPGDPMCQALRVLVMYPHTGWYENKKPLREERLGSKLHPTLTNPTVDLLSLFPSLEHVTLVSTSVTDRLLDMLTEQRKDSLRSLTINFYPCGDESVHVSSEAWKRLTEACPKLQVSTCFGIFVDIYNVLKIEAPLVSIAWLNNGLSTSDIDSIHFPKLCIEHSDTLQKVVFLFDEDSNPQPSDEDYRDRVKVLDIVRACEKLVEFHYNGRIDDEDMISFAAIPRSWKSLTIAQQGLTFASYEDEQDDDELARLQLMQEQNAELIRDLNGEADVERQIKQLQDNQIQQHHDLMIKLTHKFGFHLDFKSEVAEVYQFHPRLLAAMRATEYMSV